MIHIFEGVDLSGKTTQAELFHNFLKEMELKGL